MGPAGHRGCACRRLHEAPHPQARLVWVLVSARAARSASGGSWGLAAARACGRRQQENGGAGPEVGAGPTSPLLPASVRVFRHKPLRLHVRLRGARGTSTEADRDKHHRRQLWRPGLPHCRCARVRERPRPRAPAQPCGAAHGQALGAALVPQAGAQGAGDGRGGVAAAAQQPLRGAGLGHCQGLGAVRLAEVRSPSWLYIHALWTVPVGVTALRRAQLPPAFPSVHVPSVWQSRGICPAPRASPWKCWRRLGGAVREAWITEISGWGSRGLWV